MKALLTLSAVVCCTLCSCQKGPAKTLAWEIVSSRPHDGTSYTQGFELNKGRLFESSGQYGESALRELDPATGKVLRKRPLAKTVFGEGMTILNNEMWVLTWHEGTAYVFEPDTFKPLRNFKYQGEGWGLANDGKELIMSDGSSTLKFINPKDFSVTRKLEVKDGGRPVEMLNELEVADGQIYANVYLTDRIARISPETGQVTAWLDLKGIRNQMVAPGRAEVLNGITWDSSTGHFLVTGKYWPMMFELKLTEK